MFHASVTVYRVLLDILIGILRLDASEDALERVNLNLPTDQRDRLKRLAARLKRTEGELARELLVEALDRKEREQMAEAIAASRTPERRARDLLIARAMERLRGSPR